MRRALSEVAASRTAHFASNLGVVELCLALHRVFDFSRDRLIWDTGHQIYPHKLITGRYRAVRHDPHPRRPDGLPQPRGKPLRPVHDRPRRLQRLHGARAGQRRRPAWARKIAAAWRSSATARSRRASSSRPSTMPAASRSGLLVILNDNRMSICPRVGGLAEYLDSSAPIPGIAAQAAGWRDHQGRAGGWRADGADALGRQGRDQEPAAWRHAVRGTRHPLLRPDRGPLAAEPDPHTWRSSRRRRGRSCCTW